MSWFVRSSPASGSALAAWNLLGIISLPFPRLCTNPPSKYINKLKTQLIKKKFSTQRTKYRDPYFLHFWIIYIYFCIVRVCIYNIQCMYTHTHIYIYFCIVRVYTQSLPCRHLIPVELISPKRELERSTLILLFMNNMLPLPPPVIQLTPLLFVAVLGLKKNWTGSPQSSCEVPNRPLLSPGIPNITIGQSLCYTL